MLDVAPMDALEEHLQRWTALRTTCAPADRDAADEGIRLAYQAAGLSAPARIIWCGGPIEIAQQLVAATARDQIGSNVKAQVFDAPQRQVCMFAEIFWKEIIVAASDLANKRAVINTARNSLARATQTSREITGAVRDATQDIFSHLSIRTRYVVERWRGLPRMLPVRTFSGIALYIDQLASLGVYVFLL